MYLFLIALCLENTIVEGVLTHYLNFGRDGATSPVSDGTPVLALENHLYHMVTPVLPLTTTPAGHGQFGWMTSET